jgi:hypothetical protein
MTGALEMGLFVLEHERYLMEEYTPLIRAAGYLPENIACLQGGDCYFLATAIMGQIRSRARVITKGVFSETDYIGALRNMTLAELFEMRKQIDYKPSMRSCKSREPKKRSVSQV